MSEKSCIVIPKQMQVHSLLMLQMNPDPPEPPQTMSQLLGIPLPPVPGPVRDPNLPPYVRNPLLPPIPDALIKWRTNPMGHQYLDLRLPTTIHTAPVVFPWPDTSRPAPPLPPGYGTRQYPSKSDLIRPGYAAEEEMKRISIETKEAEWNQLYDAKVPHYRRMRRHYRSTANYCSTCSEHSSTVHLNGYFSAHKHFSSKAYRLNAPVDVWGNYPCTTCRSTPHSHKVGERIFILITSSTMCNWQGDRKKNGYPGDEVHVDYLSIPGATISTLHHALLAEYGRAKTPVDICLIAGLNDILRDRTAEKVMKDILAMRKSVDEKFKYGHDSTFAVCTLPFAPICASLPAEGREMGFKTNKLEELTALTRGIKTLNQLGGHAGSFEYCVPQFHTWGLKSSSSPIHHDSYLYMSNMEGVRDEYWREKKTEKKLHLSDHKRLMAGKAIQKYFQAVAGIITPNRHLQKSAGRKREGKRTCVDMRKE